MEFDGLPVIAGYVAGVFTAVVLTRGLEYVHLFRLMELVIMSTLLMTSSVLESANQMFKLRKDAMAEAGVKKSELDRYQAMWDNEVTLWKEITIIRILRVLPYRLAKHISFRSWEEAMDFIREDVEYVPRQGD